LGRRWYVASVSSAAVVGVLLGLLLHGRLTGAAAVAKPLAVPELHGQATWKPGARPAPRFGLRDQHGRRVELSSLRSGTVVLTFMDSLCKGACPIEGKLIASAIRQVRPAERPRLVVVSVDPAGDTRASARAAIRTWKLPADTTWLLGTHATLKRVWDAYRITVEPVSGDIVHSTALYLIDRRGDERAGFLLPFVPGLVADDLRALAT
jgi:cytochrome oxidase Cu insertion factor (SCO1/SenC/PrrC family)